MKEMMQANSADPARQFGQPSADAIVWASAAGLNPEG